MNSNNSACTPLNEIASQHERLRQNQGAPWLVASLFVFVAVSFSTAATAHAACSSVKNNRDACATPSVERPAAGGSYIDPIFGTKIIRVTDQGNNHHAYSYWSPFNVTSTLFILSKNNAVHLYSLDSATDTIADQGIILSDFDMAFEGLIWSGVEPDILYGIDNVGSNIYKYNVVSKVRESIGTAPWTGMYLHQISMSEDDQAFGFTIKKRSNYGADAIGAWKRGTNSWMRFKPAVGINEAQVDKSGRYVYGVWEDQTDGATVWDLQTDTHTDKNQGSCRL